MKLIEDTLPKARELGLRWAVIDDGWQSNVGDWKPLTQSADPPSLVDPVRFSLDGKRVVGHTRAGWVSWPAAGGPPTSLAADTLRQTVVAVRQQRVVDPVFAHGLSHVY